MFAKMDQKNILCEKAAAYFLQGYNCAQSVLLTMFEHWKRKSNLIPRIATGFGGGIGRCGSVCGALTGGVMALGIKHGTNEPTQKKRLKVYELAHKLYNCFHKQHGTVLCRELIGYDLSNPEELEEAWKVRIFEKRCVRFVKTTIEIIVDLSEC